MKRGDTIDKAIEFYHKNIDPNTLEKVIKDSEEKIQKYIQSLKLKFDTVQSKQLLRDFGLYWCSIYSAGSKILIYLLIIITFQNKNKIKIKNIKERNNYKGDKNSL